MCLCTLEITRNCQTQMFKSCLKLNGTSVRREVDIMVEKIVVIFDPQKHTEMICSDEEIISFKVEDDSNQPVMVDEGLNILVLSSVYL